MLSKSKMGDELMKNEEEGQVGSCFLSWWQYAAAAAKSLQWCLTLCDPIDGSPLGSPVPGILHARTLEWVAISFSNEWKWKMKVKLLIRVRLSETPWTAAYQAPPSMGFSRQEYWSGVQLPSLWWQYRQILIEDQGTSFPLMLWSSWSHQNLSVPLAKEWEGNSNC